MKLVYIAHRYGGGRANLDSADRCVIWAAQQGVLPIAPWISFCRQWAETPENRAKAMALNMEAIAKCDELWMCGNIMSPGMRQEEAAANRLNIPVYFPDTQEATP